MEDSNNKDAALRRAIRNMTDETRTSLPSNFAFTTMQRIRAERRRAERRNRIVAIISLTMMCIAGIGTFLWLCADSIVSMLHRVAESPTGLSSAITTAVCLTFFSVLNAILRKRFNRYG